MPKVMEEERSCSPRIFFDNLTPFVIAKPSGLETVATGTKQCNGQSNCPGAQARKFAGFEL
jgi:hypothetical protein